MVEAIDGLSPDQLTYRPDGEGNSIGWLIWHLSRVQDDHLAEVAGIAQAWTAKGFAQRFALPFDDAETGYGHAADQVAQVRPESADLLLGYHDAVFQQTLDYVKTLQDADLDRVVDTRWDPPVTLGARLISVISDDLQHAGQAAYVAGLLKLR